MDIIIVDDNKNFLEAASLFIETRLGYIVLDRFESPLHLFNSKNIHKADCILMDIEMPDLNGIEAAKMILKDFNKLKFIAITNHSEKVYLEQLICVGFKGCVFKNNLFKQLPKAIDKVVSGKLFFPNDIKI